LSAEFLFLEEIDVSKNTLLEHLSVNAGALQHLDVSKNNNLKFLDIGRNQFSSIDLSKNLELDTFFCIYNDFIAINLTNNDQLKYLNCSYNSLTTLDLFDNIELERLECRNNRELSILDVSANANLSFVDVNNCRNLIYLNTRNGIKTSSNTRSTSLRYACGDEDDSFGNAAFLENVIIDSYCNFSITDNFSPMIGKINFAESTTQCSQSNNLVNQLVFTITNLDTTVSFPFRNDDDRYQLMLPPGQYQVNPSAINNNLFSVEPDQVTFNLTSSSDTIFQDFCIIPNGNRLSDVYIKIIPIGVARPGFNMDYKVILGNRGSISASGNYNITTPSELTEIYAIPENATFNNEEIQVSYTDLEPFRIQCDTFTLRLNSPMDSPPLNNGDRISLHGKIYSDKQEHKIRNNKIYICHDIVNSYDPNDKQCLQGDFIQLDSLIENVEYMIRFENEGTAEAVNITIRDSIDSGVFNVESIRIIDASHRVHLELNNDVVEFIFEDIYLPFSDDYNDGYVVFELDLKSNVNAGNIIENNADIFFDFNFPIRTNTTSSILIDDIDGDGYYTLDDCDDNDPTVHPGAAEISYNGVDDDCDPFTADDDLDQDGYLLIEDCNDQNSIINPSASEICGDGIDQNCDGIDEFITGYLDADQDGYGDPETFLTECFLPNGYVSNNSDCEDNNPNINPNQTEQPYNGIDDDCNSATLDDDLDQDGFLLADDCDDNNSNINPDQTEEPYNGVDDDCNAATLDDDLDQDGFLLDDDCDDNNPNINPDQTEEPYNGIDDDCDSATLDDDLDQDGFLLAEDCDDNNPNINPDGEEIPNNGIDEDCDGMDLVSSIHELSNSVIKIYPNPAINIINIDIEGQLVYNVELYDLKGKLIKSTSKSNQIKIEPIPHGTYLLQIKDLKTGQKIVDRIVIGR